MLSPSQSEDRRRPAYIAVKEMDDSISHKPCVERTQRGPLLNSHINSIKFANKPDESMFVRNVAAKSTLSASFLDEWSQDSDDESEFVSGFRTAPYISYDGDEYDQSYINEVSSSPELMVNDYTNDLFPDLSHISAYPSRGPPCLLRFDHVRALTPQRNKFRNQSAEMLFAFRKNVHVYPRANGSQRIEHYQTCRTEPPYSVKRKQSSCYISPRNQRPNLTTFQENKLI